MERYTVSADGQSVTDNRTHAPVPLPKDRAMRELVDGCGAWRNTFALTLWAKSLNS